MLEPRLARVAGRYADRMAIYRVDIDRDTPIADDRFRVKSIPAIMFLIDGREVERLDGLITDRDLDDAFERVAATRESDPRIGDWAGDALLDLAATIGYWAGSGGTPHMPFLRLLGVYRETARGFGSWSSRLRLRPVDRNFQLGRVHVAPACISSNGSNR